jgi:hypothetical protein
MWIYVLYKSSMVSELLENISLDFLGCVTATENMAFAYFPYFEEMKVGLCDLHAFSVSVCQLQILAK